MAVQGVQAGTRQVAHTTSGVGWNMWILLFLHPQCFTQKFVFTTLQLAAAQHQTGVSSPGTLPDRDMLPGTGHCQAASAAPSKRDQ